MESHVFGFDEVEEYCWYFNLTIQTNYDEVKWTLLKGKDLKNEVAEFLQKYMAKKPWWKFW